MAMSRNNVEDTLRGASGGMTICGCCCGAGGRTDATGGGTAGAVESGESGLVFSISPSFAGTDGWTDDGLGMIGGGGTGAALGSVMVFLISRPLGA